MRSARVWSTISSPLLFAAAAWVIVDPRVGVIAGAASFAGVFLAIEAIARRQLVAFVATVTVLVAAWLVTLAVVRGVLGQWRIILGALFVGMAFAVLVANVRDLRRG